MNRVISIFHKLSHVKYLILIAAQFYIFKPLLMGIDPSLQDLNKALILMGLALSLDSFKDYSKLNWFDKKVYHRPGRAKWFYLLFGSFILVVMALGAYGYFHAEGGLIKEISFGLISLSIGCMGMLKSAMNATMEYIKQNPELEQTSEAL